jgi:hypothetical protein
MIKNIEQSKDNPRLYKALKHLESIGKKAIYYPALHKVSISGTMMSEVDAARFVEKIYSI